MLLAGEGVHLRAALTHQSIDILLAHDSRAIIPWLIFAIAWDIFMRIFAKDKLWNSSGYTPRNIEQIIQVEVNQAEIANTVVTNL